MRITLCVLAAACMTLSACNTSTVAHRDQAGSELAGEISTGCGGESIPESAGSDGLIVAQAVHHGNLTIFPVLSKEPRMADRFITLEAGLKAGTVEIREVGSGQVAPARGAAAEGDAAEVDADDDVDLLVGDVNRLVVVNRSDKPLYLMPGEVLIGGSQDRTVAEETIVAATGEPVTIEVYCVEQGRWGMRDLEQSTELIAAAAFDSEADAPERDDLVRLAAQSNSGKFVATTGHLSKSGRAAAQGQAGQHEVWQEVAKGVALGGLASPSLAFTDHYADDDTSEGLQLYVDALGEHVARLDQVVGVVVAIGGKVESADVFESTPLFRKLWPRLLKSYALDALHATRENRDGKVDSSAVAADITAAREFLDDLLAAPHETRDGAGGVVVGKRDTARQVMYSTRATVEPAPAMGGAFGGSVHAAGFSK